METINVEDIPSEIDSTVYIEAYNHSVNVRNAKTIVFTVYLDNIIIDDNNDNYIAQSAMIPRRYSVMLYTGFPEVDKYRTTWKELSGYSALNLGTLTSLSDGTFSEKTGLSAEYSWEEYFDVPASAKLFSNNVKKYNSYITYDDVYDTYDYEDPLEYKINGNNDYDTILDDANITGQINGFPFDRKYWENNYTFSSGYNYAEYQLHNFDKKIFKEDITKIGFQDISLYASACPSRVNAIGLIYMHENGSIIPVTYCELHNSMHISNMNVLIECAIDGVFTVA